MLNSLRSRLALIFIGLAVIPLLLAGAIIGIRSFTVLEQQSLELQRQVATKVGSEIKAAIEERENELVLLDEVYRLGVLEPKEQRAIMSNTLLRQHAFQELVLLNLEGQEQIRLSRTSVILDSELESRAGNEEFLFPATGGGTYLGPVRFDETIREPLATISVPLFDQRSGEIVSVLAADLRFKIIWDLLADIELSNEGDIYVIDQAGQVVAHRNPTTVLSHTTIDLPEADGRAEGLSRTNVIVARHNLQFGNQQLVVIAEQPVSDALELATNTLVVVATVICAALAFAVILVMFTTRRIVRPIEALATSARAISSGDFSQQVEVSSRDEIGVLAAAFNKMAEDLVRTTTSIDNLDKEITERKQAEEALRESEERYRDLFENAHDMIQSVAPDGHLIFVNRAWRVTLGYSEADLPALNLFDIIHPESLSHCQELFSKVMAGESVGNVRATFVAKDGRSVQVEGNATARCVDGRVVATHGIFRDVTERGQAEQREKKLQQELNISSRLASVGEMASGIAHEINNPLTSVIGFSELLMSRPISNDIRDDLKVINSEAQRVAKIVSGLLTFARQHKAGRESVDTNAIISEVLKLRSHQMEVNNIQVATQLASDLPPTMADAGQLQQVFLNIIINAEKEMIKAHSKGRLLVKSEKVDDMIRISFADDGPGISKENLDKIFDPFFTTREAGNGTGLGLSICHGIVAQHNGRIYAQSDVGKGATFIVELPIVADAEQTENAAIVEEEPWQRRGAKILVVDDEPAILDFLECLLSEQEYQVETINRADLALAKINDDKYDLILLDIKLPGMNGIELYRHIEATNTALAERVLFITGDVMETTTKEFLDKTKAEHISKPINIEQFKRKINHILTGALERQRI